MDIIIEFISIFLKDQFTLQDNGCLCIKNKLSVFLLQLGTFLSQKDCAIAIKIFTIVKGVSPDDKLDFKWLPLLINVYDKVNCKDEVLEKLLYDMVKGSINSENILYYLFYRHKWC